MKRFVLVSCVSVGVLVVIVSFYLWWDHSQRYISTEDAFISGRPHQITVRIPGTVVKVFIHDNQNVLQGEPLFYLDNRDYRIKLDTDKAALSRLKYVLIVDQSKIAESEADRQKIQSDLKRSELLNKGGFSTDQDVDHLRLSLKSMDAHLKGLNNQVKADKANFNERRSQVKQDFLNLSHALVKAPISGRVTARSVVKGLYVKPGDNLGYVVSFDIWVIANLKEVNLTHVRPGDPVRIRVDAYPGMVFRGKVQSIQQTTGAVMALLPPENATGNFTKVVQRLPVRIALDPGTDPDHLLRLGLSVIPTIHVDSGTLPTFSKAGQAPGHSLEGG